MHDISVEIIDKSRMASLDFEKTIFELNNQIGSMTSKADQLDYFVAVASGIVCGLMDILWLGDFSLERGRELSDKEVGEFVKNVAKAFGCKDDDLKGSVAFLEKMFPLAADGNTPDFGGGLQHHLRDFAHHPTIVGLIFSLLTQFTKMSYGTDTTGAFLVVPVPEKSLPFIGTDIPDKIFKGTIVWFFHLVSDIAGSSSTAGLSGGTGIPGPILSIAKELSVLPVFKDIKVNDESVSKFLSKLFNGTLFAQHDETGKIIKGTEIKFDFRGELGVVAELGRQAIPVIANDCIVRTFYFVRRLISELQQTSIQSFDDIKSLDWKNVKPFGNPTVTRMLTIATGVFTAIDVTEAIVTDKYFVSVNYVGVGRFTVALGAEMVNYLKVRDVQVIKNMYENIERNTYTKTDDKIYERLGNAMVFDKFGMRLEQTEILYNIELYKTINDVNNTLTPVMKNKIVSLKSEWVEEWKNYMSLGFAGFVQNDSAVLHWYSLEELENKIKEQNPSEVWFRLVMLEAMLFEPYYPLSLEKDKDGKDVPSKKYKDIQLPVNGYNKSGGDKYIEETFSNKYCTKGFIKRLRKTYDKVTREMNEVMKTAITSLAVATGIAIVAVITAGAFAPAIAVALVGSSFPGLSGAALTSACLAYLGGGAIAAGGLGMAGGTMAIVGGGAILGAGVGIGAGGAVSAVSLMGKKSTIAQSAKLLVSVREIFLNDEKDIEYSNTVYEQYVKNIASIEKDLVELKLKESVASKEEKKELKVKIKNTEESVHAMKIAMKSMNKYNSAFAVGMGVES